MNKWNELNCFVTWINKTTKIASDTSFPFQFTFQLWQYITLPWYHNDFYYYKFAHPVRQMCRSKSCVTVRCAGTSYAFASARDSILSAQRAGAHWTDYVATMSTAIMNSRFGRLSYLCRPSVAAWNLYVSIWDLHSARPLSQLSNDPSLCRSHTGT